MSLRWRSSISAQGEQAFFRAHDKIAIFLGGAACVAVCSLGFAWLAEEMLGLNRKITHAYWWSALLMLPLGFAGIRWMTIRLAPQARGSGIPQVIAAMSLLLGRSWRT